MRTWFPGAVVSQNVIVTSACAAAWFGWRRNDSCSFLFEISNSLQLTRFPSLSVYYSTTRSPFTKSYPHYSNNQNCATQLLAKDIKRSFLLIRFNSVLWIANVIQDCLLEMALSASVNQLLYERLERYINCQTNISWLKPNKTRQKKNNNTFFYCLTLTRWI